MILQFPSFDDCEEYKAFFGNLYEKKTKTYETKQHAQRYVLASCMTYNQFKGMKTGLNNSKIVCHSNK